MVDSVRTESLRPTPIVVITCRSGIVYLLVLWSHAQRYRLDQTVAFNVFYAVADGPCWLGGIIHPTAHVSIVFLCSAPPLSFPANLWYVVALAKVGNLRG